MRSGIEIVEILDSYLKEKNLTRKQFCALVDIPQSTIATWKHKNILPTTELIAKVAAFMNVSLDWLVNGVIYPDCDLADSNICSADVISDRIYQVYSDKYKYSDGYSKEFHDKYLQDIVDYELFNNWIKGKAVLSIATLKKIADKATVSLQFLLVGNEIDTNTMDPHAQKLYQEYMYTLFSLDCLEEQTRNMFIKQISDAFELQRLREGRK